MSRIVVLWINTEAKSVIVQATPKGDIEDRADWEVDETYNIKDLAFAFDRAKELAEIN